MTSNIDSLSLSSQSMDNVVSTEHGQELLTASDDDMQAIESIYSYWFGENIDTWSKTYPLKTKLWFKSDELVDQEIKQKFEKFLVNVTNENSSICQRWQTTSRGKLVLIILFDQLSRNIYRGTSKMFQYDSLALKLAMKIIDDPTYVTTYSLPECLFLYLPLVHSENIIYTTKGADLMNDLVSQVTQRDLRKKYAINARSAKTHQQIIELFGRYPHRNQLLGRISTEDEEKYLQTAHNGFVLSVQPSKPVLTDAVNKNETICSIQSDHPRLKILVIHGFRQNANSLKRSAKKLFKELKDIATFYFANAPLPYNPTSEVKEQLLAVFGDENLPETSYQRIWWNASADSKTYHHLDVSLHYIDKLFQSEGPFDGILGFAQGASLGGILCALQPFGNISFDFSILISGFIPRAESHAHLFQLNSIKNQASLHTYGVNDILIDNDRTLKLAASFENPIVFSHPGGHYTPNTWPTMRIKQFIIEQQECLSHKQNISISYDINQSESLITFEEKLKATILNHQKCLSYLPASERKDKKLPIIPIGLSQPINEENIEIIIEHINDYLLDDVMLLVWCKRSSFYHSEPKDDNEKCVTSPFFRHWILLYLKKPDELLNFYFNFILKYGGWEDLKALYIIADQMLNEFHNEKALIVNLKAICVKTFGDQLKHDYRIVLSRPDESANDSEQENSIKNQEWIGNCAKEAPRISNSRTNPSTLMAKDIAKYIQPITNSDNISEKQRLADKGYAYQTYKRLIASVCHILEKASPNFVAEQMRSRNRKDRAFQYTKEQREQLLKAPPSSYITNPEPEPVVPCSLEELEPLLEHLILNKPGPNDDEQSIVFSRGTIMSGGRLDLCKQVVGPQGIQPLLNAMKNSSVINRLLLGNNIVGLPGAQAISQYIRFNTNSNIDTWYIAGNHFDSECISLICDALATDTKVKALWLKRNPILATGVIHITRMLETNQYLQTLDLLNTGLLDDGCEILFNAFKSNRSLKHLYIDTNGLTVRSGKIIGLHFQHNDNHLESLYLSCNAIGDAGTCEIAAGLKHDKRLKRLGLASNCIGVEGARALVDALINHVSLEQLNLGYMKATILLGGLDNVIGDEGAGEISRLIRLNQHIRSIDLTFNGISQKGLIKLRDALKQNRTLTTLKLLQFGQAHNEITKEEIHSMIEQNKIECGKQVLVNDTTNSSSFSRVQYLEKGQQLNDQINFPEHVMEIISYYRTH